MVAARGHGLHTCPQAAFADFHKIIRPMLNIPDKEIIICGMALGHVDLAVAGQVLGAEQAGDDDARRDVGRGGEPHQLPFAGG